MLVQTRRPDLQQDNLDRDLGDYSVLKQLYDVRQMLVRYLLLKILNRKQAKRKLAGFLRLIEQLSASSLKRLGHTLRSWLEPIVAMCRFNRSYGITEGFHNKMEIMRRCAYGFRNFENYRLRVLTHCRWDGIINRVSVSYTHLTLPTKRIV